MLCICISITCYFNALNMLQIYVEIERARLIKKLAKIKEEQGLIAEAADLMQEVAVSFGLSFGNIFGLAFFFNITVTVLLFIT